MSNRVDKLGVSEPRDPEAGLEPDRDRSSRPCTTRTRLQQIIGKTAQLELYDLTPSLLPPSIDASENPVDDTSLFDLLSSVQHSSIKGARAVLPLQNKGKEGLGGTEHDAVRLLLKSYHGKAPKGDNVLTVPPMAVVVTCDSTVSTDCPDSTTGIQPVPGTTYYYLFKHGTYPDDDSKPLPADDGQGSELSGTQQDFDPTTGQPIVTTAVHGSRRQALPRRSRGTRRSGARRSASTAELRDRARRPALLVPDDRLHPVRRRDRSRPAAAQRSPAWPRSTEAKNLALVLQTGALPVKFVTVERTDVSATLGKDSLKQARNAAIGGLILVMLFLLLLYRFLGRRRGDRPRRLRGAHVRRDPALRRRADAAGLRRPDPDDRRRRGCERRHLRTHQGRGARSGRSVRAAIAAGYAKGFRTIVDANVVTAITALVLFGVATAEVKGFALMLLIGTVISLVTAVAATRAMLGLLAGFRWFSDPRFMGASAERDPALAADRRRRPAAALVRDLAGRDRAERRLARPSRA